MTVPVRVWAAGAAAVGELAVNESDWEPSEKVAAVVPMELLVELLEELLEELELLAAPPPPPHAVSWTAGIASRDRTRTDETGRVGVMVGRK